MRAVVYEAPRQFTIRELPDPEPGPGQVRLRSRVTGVCGTDLHLHNGEFIGTFPLTPGHEIVGEVDRLGPGVTDLQIGQLVAVDNMEFCGHCPQCRRNRPHLCQNLRALGVTSPGGFAEHVVTPAAKCYPVDDLAADVAVMAEPTACAMHGADVLELGPGSDVLMFGAGPSGLVLTQLLAHGGAARITVAAPTEFKLELARSYGADETVLMRRDAPAAALAKLRALAPDGFDAVVDATGAIDVLAGCVDLARTGGTVLVYGMAHEMDRLTISPYEIFSRELTIKGSFTQAFTFDRALAVLRSGRVRTDGIITHRFGLDRYQAALDAAADRSCLKAVVEP